MSVSSHPVLKRMNTDGSLSRHAIMPAPPLEGKATQQLLVMCRRGQHGKGSALFDAMMAHVESVSTSQRLRRGAEVAGSP